MQASDHRHTATPRLRVCLSALLLAASLSVSAGCERKEKVLDIETPGGSLEVERSKDTGEIEIEAEDRDP